MGLRALPDGQGFAKDGVEYRLGDCLYVHPDCFDPVPPAPAPARTSGRRPQDLPALLWPPRLRHGLDSVCGAGMLHSWLPHRFGARRAGARDGRAAGPTLRRAGGAQVDDAGGEEVAVPAYAAKSRYHKGGSNVGLRAWGVCRLTAVKAAKKARASCRPRLCAVASVPPHRCCASKVYRPRHRRGTTAWLLCSLRSLVDQRGGAAGGGRRGQADGGALLPAGGRQPRARLPGRLLGAVRERGGRDARRRRGLRQVRRRAGRRARRCAPAQHTGSPRWPGS